MIQTFQHLQKKFFYPQYAYIFHEIIVIANNVMFIINSIIKFNINQAITINEDATSNII